MTLPLALAAEERNLLHNRTGVKCLALFRTAKELRSSLMHVVLLVEM